MKLRPCFLFPHPHPTIQQTSQLHRKNPAERKTTHLLPSLSTVYCTKGQLFQKTQGRKHPDLKNTFTGHQRKSTRDSRHRSPLSGQHGEQYSNFQFNKTNVRSLQDKNRLKENKTMLHFFGTWWLPEHRHPLHWHVATWLAPGMLWTKEWHRKGYGKHSFCCS